jgi:hypothetical protein
MQKKRNQWFEYQTKAAKALYVSGNAATRYSATQSIQTALSGSSYIYYLMLRGNGVQTYNMKKELLWFSRKFYG